MRLGESPAPFFDRFADYIETVVILMTNGARRIEQQISFVTAKVEHQLVRPVGIVELLVEVSKLRRLNELRTKRAFRRSSPPQMYFFDHHAVITFAVNCDN